MRLLFNMLLLLAAAATTASPAIAHPRRAFRDGPGLPRMVVIPAGHALLGSSDAETTREGRSPATAAFEHPRREVAFARPFAVGEYHVTRAEFARFVAATQRDMAGCLVALAGKWSDGPLPAYSYANPGWPQRADEPVVCVNWADATAYAEWLSARTHHRYRLLTEDEWEYAARGSTLTARWWGDDPTAICTRANGGDRRFAAFMPSDKSANLTCDDGYTFTNPVARFAPNRFGLHDMLGNAWQWTANCFAAVPVAAPPAGPCAARSIRGGSWHNSVSTLRAAARFSLPPTMRSSSLGFRVMRELP
ncbi:MAG: SUMF1/EgtB/PvdO family nonheme iron enzyme [Sphingomicrobium sp.]